MDKEFVLFHDACRQLRELLIVTKYLQDDIRQLTSKQIKVDAKALLQVLEEIQLRSLKITNSMQDFTSGIQAKNLYIRVNQSDATVETSCHELLNAVHTIIQSSSKVAQTFLGDADLARGFDEIVPYIALIRNRLMRKSLAD